MKKIILTLIVLMNVVTISAQSEAPKYQIIAASKKNKDIEEQYKIKNKLIDDFVKYQKGVDDTNRVMHDLAQKYHGQYYNGLLIIRVGDGVGNAIEGKLQVSYCSSSTQIVKKSWLQELFS